MGVDRAAFGNVAGSAWPVTLFVVHKWAVGAPKHVLGADGGFEPPLQFGLWLAVASQRNVIQYFDGSEDPASEEHDPVVAG